ncbi:unnamed protein product [Gemmataceae bacterium]|nr:unnamed protein product [Gemmataceae bacterium]VTT96512.1 unnamed protein product [Gemmataceae bacterium]
MASRELTVYVRIWVRNQCRACYARFRYLNRHAQPESGIEAGATAEGVGAYYAEFQKRGDMPCPCPQCGFYQPHMLGGRFTAIAIAVVFFAVVVLGAVAIAASYQSIGTRTGAGVAAAYSGLIALIYLHEALYNPNRNLKRNHEDAVREIDRGRLEMLDRGVPGVRFWYPKLRIFRLVSPVLAAGAVAASLACLEHGYTLNESLLGAGALLTGASLVLYLVGLLWRQYALDAGIDEVIVTVERGGYIPEDFQDFYSEPGRYKADWPGWN